MRLPWLIRQEWHDVLFAHWRVPVERLRGVVPRELEIETYDGSAWVGLVPFRLRHMRPRLLPSIPPLRDFLETNVRTYVRHGGRSGVWFFSLDAESLFAVKAARLTYRLPYFHARMSCEERDGWLEYETRRVGDVAAARLRYRARGPASAAVPGSLEHFLVERYGLFARSGDAITRADIDHAPWPLQRAEAEIEEESLVAAAGIERPDTPPLLHFAKKQVTRTWLPTKRPDR